MTQPPKNVVTYTTALFTRVYDLTADQVNHLFSAPIVIVPPPGPNKALQYLNAFWDYKFGTTAYTVSALNMRLYYGPDPNDANAFVGASNASMGNLINSSESSTYADFSTGAIPSRALITNSGISLANALADSSTTGDGTIRISLLYTVIQLQP